MKMWRKYFPSIILMAMIFALSSVHGDTVKAVGLDKETYHINGHFIMFFLLTLAYFKATKKVVLSQFYAFLYAITDEIHQLFVPGRAFQYLDLAVDFVGILLAGVILWLLIPILPKKLKNWLKN